jgi:BlaI family penicillinase repressor
MIFKPSDSELEIMQILWEKGPLTVREVNEFLNQQRRVGYTTTLKIMQIMSEKKMLIRDTRQRSHIYSPTVESGDIQTNILDHVIKTAFRGNATNLVLRALGGNSATPAEMNEIKALIEEMEKKNNGTI